MIPKPQLEKRARKLYEDIDKALVYINDEVIDGTIMKTTCEKNVVKVYVSLSSRSGRLKKIEVIDKDGDIMQVQYFDLIKSSHYKFLAVVEIRVENQVITGADYGFERPATT